MKSIPIILLFVLVQQLSWGQDSLVIAKPHSPKKATNRSAMIPGWGQAYNKQYWKIPLVYGVLSIPVISYQYNNNYYQKTKFAYEARIKENLGDNSDVSKIDPDLKNLSAGSLQSYRNVFRKSRDYSIMWFIFAWGFNVLDATVSGHLKEFNVSDNLSLRVAPMTPNAFQQTGLSLQLNLKHAQ